MQNVVLLAGVKVLPPYCIFNRVSHAECIATAVKMPLASPSNCAACMTFSMERRPALPDCAEAFRTRSPSLFATLEAKTPSSVEIRTRCSRRNHQSANRLYGRHGRHRKGRRQVRRAKTPARSSCHLAVADLIFRTFVWLSSDGRHLQVREERKVD